MFLTRFLQFVEVFPGDFFEFVVDKFARHTIVRVRGIATFNAILDDVGGGSAVGACDDVSCSLHKLKMLTFDETITKFRKVQFFSLSRQLSPLSDTLPTLSAHQHTHTITNTPMHCAQTRQSGQDDKRPVRGRDFLRPPKCCHGA
jgi:hypothetical protein